MRKPSVASPLNNTYVDFGPLAVVKPNAYAVGSGAADTSPDVDEYAIQMADLIAQRVVERLLPYFSAAQKSGIKPPLPVPSPVKAEQLLTDNEVAALFKVSKQTIWRWIKTSERFPKPLKIEKGSTRWRLSEIVEYEAGKAGVR